MLHFLEFLTFTELLLCYGIVIVAAILQVSVGMGFGMLAAPLIALIKPEIVPGAILTMGLVVASLGAWKERANISISELKLGVVGRIIGSGVALCILLLVPDIDVFFILFGFIMLAAVLVTASGLQLKFNDTSLFRLSIVSGVVGTITAVGAPPMAIIYHDRDPKIVRPTLNAFFGAGSILGLISLASSGWLTLNSVLAACLLLPAMLIGVFLSEPFKSIPSIWLSRALLFLSGTASAMLIFKGLTSF